VDQAKRETILAAACRAFTRFGFKKTSIDDVAKHAGVAKGTVYLAVESKEDLFYQAVHRQLREYIAACAKLVDPRRVADQLVEQMVRGAFALLEHYPLVKGLMLGEYHEILPAWGGRMSELRAIGKGPIEEVLRLGVRQGRFRHDLDIEETATVLQDIHIASHLFHAQELLEHPDWIERRLRAGLRLVLDGIRA
jgi:AcrR family transcriptional regulator